MEQISRHILLVITTVIVTGMIINCLFFCQNLIKEIGLVGALIVSLFSSFVYSIFISVGIVLFILTYKKLNKEYKLYIILLSSSIVFNIIYIDYINKLFEDSWLNIIVIYIFSTYFLVSILSLLSSKIHLK